MLIESTGKKATPLFAGYGRTQSGSTIIPCPGQRPVTLKAVRQEVGAVGYPDSVQGYGDLRAAEHHSQDAPCGARHLEGKSFREKLCKSSLAQNSFPLSPALENCSGIGGSALPAC